jgi:predicted homoserine dehydrogenase-like protein
MSTASFPGSRRVSSTAGVVPASTKSPRLRIGMIGGVERSEGLFQQAATSAGYELEVHSGHTAGRGAQTLAALVNRVDMVVIVTDVNSHNAVVAARKLAVSRGVRLLLVRRCSPKGLISLIQSATSQTARAA